MIKLLILILLSLTFNGFAQISPDRLDVKIDPVCQMSMESHPISDILNYGGKVYGFCSAGCKEAFSSNPQKFLSELPKMALAEDIYLNKILNAKGTTEQEYIYVTNGIPTSISSSLDIKNGYTINGEKNFDGLEGSDYISSQYNFRFATLERESDNSVAAIIVKLISDYHHKTFWFCIPVHNDALFKKFAGSVSASLGEDSTTGFAFALIGYFLDSKLLEQNFDNKIKGTSAQAILGAFGLTDTEISKVQQALK